MPIYPDDLAEHLKPHAGKPWRPANGFEGDMFAAHTCETCAKSDQFGGCEISTRAWFYEKSDPDYPREWVIGDDGQPCCMAYAEIEAGAP